jgi:hypothetical protein
MTRTLVSLATPDASAFAKTLKTALDARHAAGKAPPSHLELLNLLARATGLRNFATLKAQAPLAAPQAAATNAAAVPEPEAASSTTATPASSAAKPLTGRRLVARNSSREAVELATLSPTVRKTLMQFDAAGRLVRLPNKLSVQQLAMWTLWTRFTVRRKYSEREVNALINAHHTFGDHATLRRELVNMKLLGRKSDCSEYWKEPQRPAPEVQQFLQAWRAGLH